MSSPPDLSLCLIVRDEAARLSACLDSVRGLDPEIVVVDTGSVDGTPAVARAAGARVREIPWPHDFSAARNASLEMATGRWILVLDADERLPEDAVEALRRIVAGPADHACGLIQRNALAGGAGHVAVRIVRLFPRRADVRFERPIHEQVNTGLERARIPIVDTDIAFDHSGYVDGRIMPGKLARNRAIIEAALARDPDGDPHLRYFHAGGFFDAGDDVRAAEEYAACARAARGRRPRLARVALIKQAECLGRLGRLAEAVSLLAAEPGTEAHPLACELRATEADSRGRGIETRRWRERLLAMKDTAYLPPVALKPMKLRALEGLAEGWFRDGRKEVAVRLLRVAVEFAQGCRPAGDGLAADYARAVGG